jgi:hypothetical protein
VIYVATRVATPVDACGRSNTIQHDDPCRSNTQQHAMDVSGRTETKLARTSKPLVGILADVDGRIVPIALPPCLIPILGCPGWNVQFDRIVQSANGFPLSP